MWARRRSRPHGDRSARRCSISSPTGARGGTRRGSRTTPWGTTTCTWRSASPTSFPIEACPACVTTLEWDLAVLGARRDLEEAFEAGLRTHDREASPWIRRDVPDRLREIAAPPDADSLPAFIEREATLDQAREFLMHRSAYQLKEADPHSWVIPRLDGAAKTAVMEIQYDEYGSGDPAWMHSELFRTTMIAAGLDGSYGAYLDRLPGPTLATVNLITLFGMHRRWRGALVGHLAAFEMTSSLPNRAYAHGFRRLGFDDDAVRFFDEHVEADSVHEVLAARSGRRPRRGGARARERRRLRSDGDGAARGSLRGRSAASVAGRRLDAPPGRRPVVRERGSLLRPAVPEPSRRRGRGGARSVSPMAVPAGPADRRRRLGSRSCPCAPGAVGIDRDPRSCPMPTSPAGTGRSEGSSPGCAEPGTSA